MLVGWYVKCLKNRFSNEATRLGKSVLNSGNATFFRVESKNCSANTNSVMYIPVGPDCPMNRMYVERMRFLFKSGQGPDDFKNKPDNEYNYSGKAKWEELSYEARVMMGSKKYIPNK